MPKIAEGMQVIRTSGVQFIRTLKSEFPEDELIPDSNFEITPYIRAVVHKAHHELLATGEMRTDPAMFLCACYQDGLLDAFDHQMANESKGLYHHRCYVQDMMRFTYQDLLDERREEGIWHTVAYIHGYMRWASVPLG